MARHLPPSGIKQRAHHSAARNHTKGAAPFDRDNAERANEFLVAVLANRIIGLEDLDFGPSKRSASASNRRS